MIHILDQCDYCLRYFLPQLFVFNECLQLLATVPFYCFLFLTNAWVFGREILVSGGEQVFAGISVAQVVQLPFLVLQAQVQRYLLVWSHCISYLTYNLLFTFLSTGLAIQHIYLARFWTVAVPLPSPQESKGACVPLPGHKVCLCEADGMMGKKSFMPSEVRSHFILQSHKAASHCFRSKWCYCSVWQNTLFLALRVLWPQGLWPSYLLIFVSCLLLQGLLMVVVVPFVVVFKSVLEKLKSVFFHIFSRLYLFFSEVLIYSEFKIAEKSILTERNVAIDR